MEGEAGVSASCRLGPVRLSFGPNLGPVSQVISCSDETIDNYRQNNNNNNNLQQQLNRSSGNTRSSDAQSNAEDTASCAVHWIKDASCPATRIGCSAHQAVSLPPAGRFRNQWWVAECSGQHVGACRYELCRAAHGFNAAAGVGLPYEDKQLWRPPVLPPPAHGE